MRVAEPEIAEDVSFSQLDKDARGRLRGLSKENAEQVGLHLVMAGRLLDVNPELAYEHAQAAVRRGGRVDIVREAAGLAAYHTGRYAEALRELRTVRRLNGSSEHLPLMADAERGLGRPERALALAASDEASTLDAVGRTELAIVVSGARTDLGEHDAALAALDRIPAADAQGDLRLRVLQARVVVLEAAGRTDEAAALLATVDPKDLERAIGATPIDEEVVVYDVYDDEADSDDEDDEPVDSDARHSDEPGDSDDDESDDDESDDDESDDDDSDDESDDDARDDEDAESDEDDTDESEDPDTESALAPTVEAAAEPVADTDTQPAVGQDDDEVTAEAPKGAPEETA